MEFRLYQKSCWRQNSTALSTMKMSEYVDLLKSKPTKYRIFLWNVLKEIPVLQKDFTFPDFGLRLMKGLPMLFFSFSF